MKRVPRACTALFPCLSLRVPARESNSSEIMIGDSKAFSVIFVSEMCNPRWKSEIQRVGGKTGKDGEKEGRCVTAAVIPSNIISPTLNNPDEQPMPRVPHSPLLRTLCALSRRTPTLTSSLVRPIHKNYVVGTVSYYHCCKPIATRTLSFPAATRTSRPGIVVRCYFEQVLLRVAKHRARGGLAATAAASVAGLIVGAAIMGEDDVACEATAARCHSAAVVEDTDGLEAPMAVGSPEREELRRTALAYLTKIVGERENSNTEPAELHAGSDENGLALLAATLENEDEGLPENLYDVDRVLSKTPILRKDNAFHDTLNGDDRISCPYVLNVPGKKGGGIEAVVRFGSAIAGHPKIVHGGITALTFDNLLGWALFLQGAGAVFTAYLKVDYKAPLPCLTTGVVDVSVDKVEGRKLFVTARLRSLDGGVLYASAEALFIKPKPTVASIGAATEG